MPTLTDILISARELAPNINLNFTKDYIYISKMDPPPTHAKVLGRRTAQKIYVAGGGCGADIAVPSRQDKEVKVKEGPAST